MKLLASWLTPLIALLAYLLFWPVPVQPVAWHPPVDAGHSGAHAVNTRLAGLQSWPLQASQQGPEHIASHAGLVYTALANGDIVRFDVDGHASTLVNTGGRPLGLEVTADGALLYVADAMKGLLSVNLSGTPQVRTLMDQVPAASGQADPIRYADAVATGPHEQVWFTDASTRFGAKASGGTFQASILDILEASCTGRVLVYEPATGQQRVALQGLCFPNGLVFSQDGRSLLVSETGTYRILKIDLEQLGLNQTAADSTASAPTLQDALNQGAAQVLIDNLPGFPDNLTRGENGRIWTGLTKPRGKMVDWAADKPWLRSAMLRLPRFLWPVPPAYGHLIAFDEQGRILDDLQDPSGAYPETTAATEVNGKLFVQSLHAHSVGWMPYTGPAAVKP